MSEELPFEEEYCLSRLLKLIYFPVVEKEIFDVKVGAEYVNFTFGGDIKIHTARSKWEFLSKGKVWAFEYESDSLNVIETSYRPDVNEARDGKAHLKHFEDEEENCYDILFYGNDEFEAGVKALHNVMTRGDLKKSKIEGEK